MTTAATASATLPPPSPPDEPSGTVTNFSTISEFATALRSLATATEGSAAPKTSDASALSAPYTGRSSPRRAAAAQTAASRAASTSRRAAIEGVHACSMNDRGLTKSSTSLRVTAARNARSSGLTPSQDHSGDGSSTRSIVGGTVSGLASGSPSPMNTSAQRRLIASGTTMFLPGR